MFSVKDPLGYLQGVFYFVQHGESTRCFGWASTGFINFPGQVIQMHGESGEICTVNLQPIFLARQAVRSVQDVFRMVM